MAPTQFLLLPNPSCSLLEHPRAGRAWQNAVDKVTPRPGGAGREGQLGSASWLCLSPFSCSLPWGLSTETQPRQSLLPEGAWEEGERSCAGTAAVLGHIWQLQLLQTATSNLASDNGAENASFPSSHLPVVPKKLLLAPMCAPPGGAHGSVNRGCAVCPSCQWCLVLPLCRSECQPSPGYAFPSALTSQPATKGVAFLGHRY